MDLKVISLANLVKAKEILERLDIVYCFFLGTALGAYRDGDFCPGDVDDIDLAVPKRFYAHKDKIIKEFENAGFEVYRVWEAEDGIAPEISFKKNECKVDLFFLTEQEGKMLWRFYLNDDATEYKTKSVDGIYFNDFEFVEFYDEIYPIPQMIESYLETNYGDWKTPIPRDQWNWSEDNQCQTLPS